MRIPPKMEKHNLDLEWPDTAMGKRALPCGLQLLSPGANTSISICPIKCQKQTSEVPFSDTSRF